MPVLSVVIPTFNSGRVIQHCLESITQQSYKDFEIVIIDGNSADNTTNIVEKFSSQHPCIHWVSEPDAGIYDAMNKGIKKATGEWILFLGSDDELFDKNVLGNAAAALDTKKADFIYGNVTIKGNSSWAPDGTVYDGPFTAEKLVQRNICHQSVFYRRPVFEQTGNFNTRYTVCADWDMNHRFFARGRTLYIPEIISRFYAGGESTTNNHDLFTDQDCVFNIKKYYGISFSNKLFRSYADFFFTISTRALKAKEYIKAIKFFLIASVHTKNRYVLTKGFIRKFKENS